MAAHSIRVDPDKDRSQVRSSSNWRDSDRGLGMCREQRWYCRICGSSLLFFLLASTLLLSACGGGSGGAGDGGGVGGGGGGGEGGGGGGGGGSSTPTITLVTPSQLMAAAVPTNPTVYGSNFTTASVVEINGAKIQTTFQSSTELWGFPASGQLASPGVYSIAVSDPAGNSNAVSLTVYSPTQGPQPFLALPGYYTGPQQSPAAIAVRDLNGDGRVDVVLSAGMNTSNIAVLLAQPDGTLGADRKSVV